MRSCFATTGVAVGSAVAVLALCGSPAFGARPAGAPKITFVSSSPLTVRGRHFAAGKVVRVTFRSGEATIVRTVHTSAAGAFTLPAPVQLTDSRCGGSLQVSAAGVTGVAATAGVKIPPRECAPVSTP